MGKCDQAEMLTDDESTAIIDDHRGYYPRKAHYDWVTTMGKCEIDGMMGMGEDKTLLL